MKQKQREMLAGELCQVQLFSSVSYAKAVLIVGKMSLFSHQAALWGCYYGSA